MKAAVIYGVNQIRLAEKDLPALENGEALIKVHYCGVCGSDIHVLHGEHPTAVFPVIPGHEFVGELVEARGAGSENFEKGDTVVAQPFFSCGNCEPCAKGRSNVCQHLRFLGAHTDGGFAEYVKVPTAKMYRYSKKMDMQLAALTEPLAVAVHDVRRSGLQAGENALIIGGGPIGILIATMASQTGAGQIIISEVNDDRRKFAEALGFHTLNPLDTDFDQNILSLTGGIGFDVVFEVSGSRQGILSATKLAKITGTIMNVGMTKEPHLVNLSDVFAKELVIKGVRIHSQYNFLSAVKLLESGVLNERLRPMISKVFPLDEVAQAFDEAQSGGKVFKVLVKM